LFLLLQAAGKMQQEAEALAVMEARATAAANQRLQLEQQLQRDDGGEVEKLKAQVHCSHTAHSDTVRNVYYRDYLKCSVYTMQVITCA
jgi:hypothetical protein